MSSFALPSSAKYRIARAHFPSRPTHPVSTTYNSLSDKGPQCITFEHWVDLNHSKCYCPYLYQQQPWGWVFDNIVFHILFCGSCKQVNQMELWWEHI